MGGEICRSTINRNLSNEKNRHVPVKKKPGGCRAVYIFLSPYSALCHLHQNLGEDGHEDEGYGVGRGIGNDGVLAVGL